LKRLPPNLVPSKNQAIIAGLLLLAMAVIFWPDLGHLRRMEIPQVRSVNLPNALADGSVSGEGWKTTPEGLALSPGGTATLRLEFPLAVGRQVILDLGIEEHLDTFLTVTADAPPFRFRVVNERADAIDITRLLGDAESCRLELECADSRESGGANLAIGRIAFIEQTPLFPLPVLAFFLASLGVVYLLLKTLASSEKEALIAFIASVVGWVVIHTVAPDAMRTLSRELFFGLAGILVWRWYVLKELSASGRRLEPIALLAVLLIALDERWEEMGRLLTRTLDPDPANYLELAQRSRFFFDSEFREPLFVFCAKLGTWVSGGTPMGLRTVTLLLSLAVIAVTWLVGRELFSRPVGLFAAAFLAFNRNFVYINIRGYRLELFTLLSVLFLWFCLGRRDWLPRRRTLALAAVGALLCLTRLNTFSVLAVMLVFVFLRNGWPKRMMAVAVCLPLLATVPSMIYWQQKYGDPMLAVNRHLKYYRNLEFAEHPSVPKEGGPYRGPDTDSVRYFLTEWHSPAKTASNIAAGLYHIFLGDYGWKLVFTGSTLLMGLCILGLARWAFTPHWPMLFWLFLLSAPVAFFEPIALDFRLILHILPILGFAAGDFLQAFWDYFRTQQDTSAEPQA